MDNARIPACERSSLKPGDILLSRGVGEISDAIRMLDGGQYSHAALWSGSAVIESIAPCVVEWSLDESLANHPKTTIDVYRYDNAETAQSRIVEMARQYIGRPYSYGDLVLVALLLAASKTASKAEVQLQFLAYGCKLNDFLDIHEEAQGELVTCVELVARAYYNAGIALRLLISPGGQLDLGVFSKGAIQLAKKPKGAAWRFSNRAPNALSRLAYANTNISHTSNRSHRGNQPARTEPAQLVRAGLDWGLNLVTPRHLELSPDLEFQGRLYEASPAANNPAL